jgi:hypothetical protein
MNAKTRRRRAALLDRVQWLTSAGIPNASSQYAHDRLAAEHAALKWALRVIDAAPELADSLAHEEP